jgi:RHS repeat-associated protein
VAGTTNLTYQYDADGNSTQAKSGTAIGTYTYPATSNRLTSITGTGAEGYGYDVAGNIVTLAGKTLIYDARGRLKTLTSGTSSWSYGINGLGQRVTKAGTGFTGSLPFVYDEQGHLIGEYTSTGVLTQETVYLGDTPVAILQTSATFYIQADQLNTPRVIINSANQQRWRWDLSEPFGNNVPNENPAALGVFKYNLRFPGQYADTETGLNYNTFRDYYPKTGGYIESDPIGLKGGINTYAYVGGNPMRYTDPRGLDNPGQGPYNYNPPGTTLSCSLKCTTTRQISCSFAYSLCRGGGAFDPTPPSRGDSRRNSDEGERCLREFEECSKTFRTCQEDCECKNADRSR